MIVDAENREFEGKDEMYTPSTHTFSETRRAQLSVDIWVEGVLSSSVPSNSRFSASGRNQAIFAFGKQPLFSH